MAPLLRADDGRNVVIRPLVYVPEEEIISYAAEAGFPVTCCACPACGDPGPETACRSRSCWPELEQAHPGIKASLLAALGDVRAPASACCHATGAAGNRLTGERAGSI